MKKEYDTSVKEAIERVMSVFSEYIKTTPYFDIVWSGKVGYIYISIDSCRGITRHTRTFIVWNEERQSTPTAQSAFWMPATNMITPILNGRILF